MKKNLFIVAMATISLMVMVGCSKNDPTTSASIYKQWVNKSDAGELPYHAYDLSSQNKIISGRSEGGKTFEKYWEAAIDSVVYTNSDKTAGKIYYTKSGIQYLVFKNLKDESVLLGAFEDYCSEYKKSEIKWEDAD